MVRPVKQNIPESNPCKQTHGGAFLAPSFFIDNSVLLTASGLRKICVPSAKKEIKFFSGQKENGNGNNKKPNIWPEDACQGREVDQHTFV